MPATMRSMSGTGATVPAISSVEQLVVAPVSPVPRSLAVGGGNAMFVDGRCVHQESSIKRLEIRFDGRTIPAMGWGMPLPERTEGDSYWWGIVEVEPIDVPRLAWIELRAELADGRIATGRLASLDLLPEPEVPEADRIPESEASQRRLPHAGERSVAICMATWEPPRDLLRAADRVDQAADPRRLDLPDQRRRLLAGGGGADQGRDRGRPPLRLSPAPPSASASIATSSARWRWCPTTRASSPSATRTTAGTRRSSSALLARDRRGATLAYSDMRIVDERGRRALGDLLELPPEQLHGLRSLVVANTVTGAASLFDGACSRTRCRSRRRSATPTTTTGSRRSRWRWAGSPTSPSRSTTTFSTGRRARPPRRQQQRPQLERAPDPRSQDHRPHPRSRDPSRLAAVLLQHLPADISHLAGPGNAGRGEDVGAEASGAEAGHADLGVEPGLDDGSIRPATGSPGSPRPSAGRERCCAAALARARGGP